MLTKKNEGLVAGIHGLEWDAVEQGYEIGTILKEN
jgi:hypothetical protein